MKVSLMAALAENGVIGQDNALPWHLPNDLQHFKATTLGKPIIMGRKTWESLGRPLPGRKHIVITRQTGYEAPGIQVVSTLDAALQLAQCIALADGVEESVIIGGAEIYALALPRCDRMYLTEVHADVPGDTFFPAFDHAAWREVQRERFVAENNNPHDYSFVVYERI